MGFKAIVVDIKADWPELTTGMGFTTCASNTNPCLFCAVPKSQLKDHSLGVPLLPSLGKDAYEEEMRNHEKWIVIRSEDDHRKLRFRLKFMSKAKGRVLTHDVP
eukprot:4806901-Pyramimonas_sp.AAC.1